MYRREIPEHAFVPSQPVEWLHCRHSQPELTGSNSPDRSLWPCHNVSLHLLHHPGFWRGALRVCCDLARGRADSPSPSAPCPVHPVRLLADVTSAHLGSNTRFPVNLQAPSRSNSLRYQDVVLSSLVVSSSRSGIQATLHHSQSLHAFPTEHLQERCDDHISCATIPSCVPRLQTERPFQGFQGYHEAESGQCT